MDVKSQEIEPMTIFYGYIDIIFFIIFSFWVSYIFLFAVASRRTKKPNFSRVAPQTRFVILFPAFQEDNVIKESIQSFKRLVYPPDLFQVIVISDQMKQETNAELIKMGAKLCYPQYTINENRSKAAALKFAMSHIDGRLFDAVIIMDADNMVAPDFLNRLNDAFVQGAGAVQAHRVAKNKETATAFLDGISEEINNAIFRLGHVQLGLPSALIGSGMGFNFDWFAARIKLIDSMGEDKLLEYYLLIDRIHTVYLDDVEVLDEKIQNTKDFSRQRRRWIASQVDVFMLSVKGWKEALLQGNWPLLDKIFQWSMPPRIIMLGLIPLFFVCSIFIPVVSAYKWLFLFILYLSGLAIAIPPKYYTKQLLIAVLSLPRLFLAMLGSILHFRSGRSTFIHTVHGELSDQSKEKNGK